MAGAAWVQCYAVLPGALGLGGIAIAGVAAGAGWMRSEGGCCRIVCALMLGLCAGILNACLQAHLRLDDALADLHQDQVSRLILRVAELPDGDERHHRFVAELAEPARPGIPSRILVTWQAPPGAAQSLPALLPGQIWRMALVLRRPHGVLNPAGPDAEARMFARGLRAVGTVRGRPQLLDDRPWASAGVLIERARHHVRTGMRNALGDHRYAPVLIALAIGDQAGVALVNDNKVLF
ncbi:ComEC/Rec2 family competence protein [Achromobacter piechaudii]|uniref:DUF4131 domain-containing protein n=1 Tax=Achromobacter piechaudii ATCC 43553 TaxID=742159 RepID=D4XEX1_9BURK|nr:hypothetical protein HMPREF0004_4018 [Achromobacter piechaudii ATCC 43553]